MQTEVRKPDTGVIGTLEREPHRFGFFQALKLLELHFSGRENGEAAVAENPVRFRNNLSLGFPASEIAELSMQRASTDESADREDIQSVSITPAFFGLLGAQGALPLHYTEKISERELFLRDRGAREFLDLFLNRATAQLYAAWKKYRLGVQYETGGRDHFMPLLLAFAGYAGNEGAGILNNETVPEEAHAHFAAVFGHRPVSGETLRRMLSAYFSTQITVEPFIGRWYAVPEMQRTRLGAENACLGSTAMVGERVWQRDLRMRLCIGPLARERYRAFLPGGHCAKALEHILESLTGHTVEFEVVVSLRKEDVTPVRLGNSESGRLGLDSFLITEKSARDRDDSCFSLLTIH